MYLMSHTPPPKKIAILNSCERKVLKISKGSDRSEGLTTMEFSLGFPYSQEQICTMQIGSS